MKTSKITTCNRQRLDGLPANDAEIIDLLSDHLRADIGDFVGCLDSDGRLNLAKAKALGLSRLIKRYRSRTRIITRPDGSIVREVTTAIELHDSQAAARTLAKIFRKWLM